jgi:hypothetical protein
MKLAAVGAFGVVAGGATLAAMAKLVKHGEDFVHQQALMHSAGMSQLEVAEATAKAWQNTRDVLGTGVAENMKNIRELRMVFGDTQEALANLRVVTQAQTVMNSVRGHGAGDQVFDMAKALEIKGVSMDPQHFNALIDAMVKAAIASGGRVMGSDFFSAFKYGRTATQGWDDRFVGLILPTLIQEMKGGGGSGGTGGPGNALQSAFQAVVGGTMSNKAAEEFYRIGLLDPSKVIHTSTGSVKGIRPGGVKGSAEFQADPYQWVQDVLMPALKAKGITTPEAIREEISHMFVNRTAQQIMIMFATQQQRFEKDAELTSKAQGTGAYDDLIKNDPVAKMKAFTEAWSNLMTALGAPLVEPAYNTLMKITDGLNYLTKKAAEHPEAVRVIGEIAAGIAGLAVALGTIAIGTAAMSALIAIGGPVGVIALIGVAAAVTAANLDKLHNAIQNLLPEWLREKRDAAGNTPLEDMRKHGVQVPWWMPLPFVPNREAPPDLNLNHHLPGYHKESYVPPPGGGARIQTVVYTMLDGRVLAKTASEEQGRVMSLPNPGTIRFDSRQTVSFPSDILRA